MAAYHWVYDSPHLQAHCQAPGSAPEPYARQSSMGYIYLFYLPLTESTTQMASRPVQLFVLFTVVLNTETYRTLETIGHIFVANKYMHCGLQQDSLQCFDAVGWAAGRAPCL